MVVFKIIIKHPPMDTTQHGLLNQRWHVLQHELFPHLREEFTLTPKLEKLIHTLEWIDFEQFLSYSVGWPGRPEYDRVALARSFVAKSVLNIRTTVGLIERLTGDRILKRICGFDMHRFLPHESTFSRAFQEFADQGLANRIHENLIKTHLGEELIGHNSRDATAIHAREKAVHIKKEDKPTVPKYPRGRPKKGEKRQPPEPTRIERQLTQTLVQVMAELPKQCDVGSKCNAQGFNETWKGYKFHIDTACCGVPISAILTSASMHDSQAAIPLALMTQSRVSNLYDLMDAGYCSDELREHSKSLGHIPLIDHNPRKGKKKPFEPHEAQRYKTRSGAERTNARIKDEFGGRYITVRGHAKILCHLMFGLIALSIDQLMRLMQ
jgi:hypothetical protein